jgi:hypothetical protein
MKKYFYCIIRTIDKKVIDQRLKLSEASIIPKIIKESESVTISMHECTIEQYKIYFGE